MDVDQEALYQHVPPLGQPINVEVNPFLVEDPIPEEKEIDWAVHRLRLNRLGGPSGMRVEHLRQWLITAILDDTLDVTNCQKVVAILRSEFCDGILAK